MAAVKEKATTAAVRSAIFFIRESSSRGRMESQMEIFGKSQARLM